MERTQWGHQYRRLLTAFTKKSNAEQSGEYFLALQPYPGACVHEAITGAIREAKYWPTAADLVERARLARHSHQVPASACDVCHGSTFTQHMCSPETPCGADHPAIERVPIFKPNPAHTTWIERSYMHQYARRCWQCWPSNERAS